MIKAIISSFFVFCCMGVAYAQESTSTASNGGSNSTYEVASMGTVVETLVALVLVVMAIFASTWLIKRINPRFRGTTLRGGIKIVSMTALGNKERLIIIDVQGQQLLLGVTPSNISLIKDLTGLSGEASEENAPSVADRTLFQRLLKR